jgi:catalase
MLPHHHGYHHQTDQGIKNFLAEEAEKLAGSNPDYAIQDLYEAIANGNFVCFISWSIIMIQETVYSNLLHHLIEYPNECLHAI